MLCSVFVVSLTPVVSLFVVRAACESRSLRQCSASAARAAAFRRLARRLARRLVRRPGLQLMLLAAVHNGLAGRAALEVAWVLLASATARQRAAAQSRRSGSRSSCALEIILKVLVRLNGCGHASPLQHSALFQTLPALKQPSAFITASQDEKL